MSAYSASDRYALELRGLGLVWTTEAWSTALPGISPAPSYRVGLIAIGGTLRSSIGVLDSRSRASGVSFELSGDTALELLRGGGDPVRDSGVSVWRVGGMGEYQSSQATEMEFGGQLAAGRYLVGAECVDVGAEVSNAGGIYRYTVTRGVRGSLTEARPVYWGPADRLDVGTLPPPVDSPQARVRTALDLVYPDLDPPTLTGWPVRLWRQTGAGSPVVVYEGVVGRIRSEGAVVSVETASRVEGDLARAWRVPAGGLLGADSTRSSGRLPGRRVMAWEVIVGDQPDRRGQSQLVSQVMTGIGTMGRIREQSTGLPVFAVPKASIPQPPVSGRWGAVQVVMPDGAWVALSIREWIEPPFVLISDYGGEQQITSSRYWYALLEGYAGAAAVVGFGSDPRTGTRVDPAGALYEDPTNPQVPRSYRWTDALGVELSGRNLRVRGARDLEVVDMRDDAREAMDREAVAEGLYLLPGPGIQRWFDAPGLQASAAPAMGSEALSVQGTISSDRPARLYQYQLRLPPAGRSVGEVIDSYLGPQARALSVSPLGAPAIIGWTLTGQGAGIAFGAVDLEGPVALELGERGRVSAAQLTLHGERVNVQVVGGSLSPRGMRVQRDLTPLLVSGTQEQQDALVEQWGHILSRYRGTIPLASFRVRDGGDGRVQALRPGSRVLLTDPVCPRADGTRGLSSAVCAVLEVALDTTRRSADVTALVLDYGVAIPDVWGPSVRINANASGTSVLLSVAPLALGRGLERFAEIIEAAGTGVAAVLWEDAGETLVTGITLSAADPEEGTIVATTPFSLPYVAGDVLTLAAFPPAAAVQGATGYYGRSRWL